MVRIPGFHCRFGVQSLVGELIFRKLRGTAKKKKKVFIDFAHFTLLGTECGVGRLELQRKGIGTNHRWMCES